MIIRNKLIQNIYKKFANFEKKKKAFLRNLNVNFQKLKQIHIISVKKLFKVSMI